MISQLRPRINIDLFGGVIFFSGVRQIILFQIITQMYTYIFRRMLFGYRKK